MFKIDFFDAFDCISWDFMDRLLSHYGFGSKQISWLVACWRTASFFVLLNVSSGESFKSSRGLRQGYPLSPMIFILTIKVLTRNFLMAQALCLINGFKVSKWKWAPNPKICRRYVNSCQRKFKGGYGIKKIVGMDRCSVRSEGEYQQDCVVQGKFGQRMGAYFK